MANQTYDIGDLRITQTSTYNYIWDDSGGGAARDICVYSPVPQGNLCPVGDYADPRRRYQTNDQHEIIGSHQQNGLRKSLLIGPNPNTNPAKPAVSRPVDYTQIWNDGGSGITHDGAFWRPIAPTGYVALGDVASAGWDKPRQEKIWCVREDLVGYGKFLDDSSWDDRGSEANSDVSIWAVQTDSVGVDGSANLPIFAATFRAQGNYSPPDGKAARVLLLPIGKDHELFKVSVQ